MKKMPKGNSKLKKVSFSKEKEIDDVILILMKQKTSEFVIAHNNILDCNCFLCNTIQKGILNVKC